MRDILSSRCSSERQVVTREPEADVETQVETGKTLLEKGEGLRSAGDWAGGLLVYKSILSAEADPDTLRTAGRRAAEAARKLGLVEEAAELIGDHIAKFPHDRAARVELGRIVDALQTSERPSPGDKLPVYSDVARRIIGQVAINATSILSVNDASRYLGELPLTDVVTTIPAQEFLDWKPDAESYDVTLFLNVLRRDADVRRFSEKLMRISDVLIVSVPVYARKDGGGSVSQREHFLKSCFGREPNFSYVAQELSPHSNLVCVYDRRSENKWDTLSRDKFRFRWTLYGAEGALDKSARMKSVLRMVVGSS